MGEADRVEIVRLGPVTIRYVHAETGGSYSLLEWIAPAAAPSPPVHIHRETDEGFYVVNGTYAFLRDGDRIGAASGEHVLVPKGHPHTFWNAGEETASCLIVLSPSGFEAYFRELADGQATADSEDAAMAVREHLSSRYDIEVVGPAPDQS
jgi:mannose-6-phosphate isomerase-like protein (cupin superfamily)